MTTVQQCNEASGWFNMSQVAKLTGVFGRNNLYAFLREQKVLMHHNEPYQEYVENGYFKLVAVDKYRKDGRLFKTFPVLLVSRKGIDFINNLLLTTHP